ASLLNTSSTVGVSLWLSRLFADSAAESVHPECVFFSSRSRHTSSERDWSSDVCSSDLGLLRLPVAQSPRGRVRRLAGEPPALPRSEERRVGKECRAPCSAQPERRKQKSSGGLAGDKLEPPKEERKMPHGAWARAVQD